MKTIEQIKALAKSIDFELNDEELEKIYNEYEDITSKLDLIDNIDVNHLEPTNFVNQKILIDDWQNDHDESYDKEKVFKNCKSFNGTYVEIKNEK